MKAVQHSCLCPFSPNLNSLSPESPDQAQLPLRNLPKCLQWTESVRPLLYLLNNLLSIDYGDGKYKGLHGPDQVGLWGAGGHMPPFGSNATGGNVGLVMPGLLIFSREARYVDFYMNSSNHEVFSQTQLDPQHTYLIIPGSDQIWPWLCQPQWAPSGHRCTEGNNCHGPKHITLRKTVSS